MNDPSTMSATGLTQSLRRREVSSRELLDHYLHRIEQDGGAVSAVITSDEDSARAQAAAADEALVCGEPSGPLCGLPMTVKDAIETAGLRTTAGAPELTGDIPFRDADAAARLRAACGLSSARRTRRRTQRTTRRTIRCSAGPPTRGMRAGHPAVRPEDRPPLSRPDTPASSSAVTWGIHPYSGGQLRRLRTQTQPWHHPDPWTYPRPSGHSRRTRIRHPGTARPKRRWPGPGARRAGRSRRTVRPRLAPRIAWAAPLDIGRPPARCCFR